MAPYKDIIHGGALKPIMATHSLGFNPYFKTNKMQLY
jgi:hypothetical protein